MIGHQQRLLLIFQHPSPVLYLRLIVQRFTFFHVVALPMEFGKDHREFDCDSPFVEGGLNEAAKTPKSTGNNDISVIQENVGCCMTTSTCITQHEENKNNEDGILRKLGRRSFEKKMEPPSGKMIHKTESFGSHLLINMDEVNSNTVTESFDKRGSILSRTSSNGLGNSFSLAEGDISDNIALRVQSPKQRSTKLKPISSYI